MYLPALNVCVSGRMHMREIKRGLEKERDEEEKEEKDRRNVRD